MYEFSGLTPHTEVSKPRPTIIRDLNERAVRATSILETDAVAQSWAQQIDIWASSGVDVSHEPHRYSERVLRVLPSIAPCVLPNTLQALSGVVEESRQKANYRDDLLTFLQNAPGAAMQVNYQPEKEPAGPREVLEHAVITALRKALLSAPDRASTAHLHYQPVHLLDFEVAASPAISTAVHELSTTRLFENDDNLDNGRQEAAQAVREVIKTHQRNIPLNSIRSAVREIFMASPDILATVLESRILPNENLKQGLEKNLMAYADFVERMRSSDLHTLSAKQAVGDSFIQISENITQLFEIAAFGKEYVPPRTVEKDTRMEQGMALDQLRLMQAYAEAHRQLQLAANWYLLHDQLK